MRLVFADTGYGQAVQSGGISPSGPVGANNVRVVAEVIPLAIALPPSG